MCLATRISPRSLPFTSIHLVLRMVQCQLTGWPVHTTCDSSRLGNDDAVPDTNRLYLVNVQRQEGDV